MIYGTGVDPNGSFLEFTKKDVCKNIDIYRDTIGHIAQGTAFTARNQSHVQSRQKNKEGNQTCNSTLLSTDHISYALPKSQRPFQKIFDQIITQTAHTANIETADKSWEPYNCVKTLTNKSSVGYDILSYAPNKYCGCEVPSILEKKITNRKKGVAEYADITRVTALRMNAVHNEAYKINFNIFKKKTGMFTHMYDAAIRNGGMSNPFKK
jgi:hypothetical protein